MLEAGASDGRSPTPAVNLVPRRHVVIARLRRRRQLEIRPMIPLLRERAGRGEVHWVFHPELVADPELVFTRRISGQ